MTKGAIYYTDNRLYPDIMKICQGQLLKGMKEEDIISCSLKPISFGRNIVFAGHRSYPTMCKQILTALEASNADVVFFTEHDVLYHPTHFDFTPARNDIYYYNVNNWRWRYPMDFAITYDFLTSLSMLCCDRKLAINHYRERIRVAEELGLDEHRDREPRWARRWGYEPGTKPKRRGGFSDEESEKWRSEYPNVDIRHRRTFSKPKVTVEEFIHPPDLSTWKETTLDEIPGWDLKGMFHL